MTRHDQHGFTLVELAIALVVIGLLIGGILKGQELIENAKITNFMRQVDAYDAGAMTFRDTYGELPGDLRRPGNIPDCKTASCLVGGDGNGRIASNPALSPADIESANFFPHLAMAGMITNGPEGGTIAQQSQFKTENNHLFLAATPLDIYLQALYLDAGILTASSLSGHVYTFELDNTSTKNILNIDTKFDDGKPFTGNIALQEDGTCPADDGGGNLQNALYAFLPASTTVDCTAYIGAKW